MIGSIARDPIDRDPSAPELGAAVLRDYGFVHRFSP
jgi:hypothetical protein